jgi:hypothetical protein
MQRLCFIVAIVAALLALGAQSALGQSAPRQREQSHFSAEDEDVHDPVAIPAAVIAMLAKDELVRNVLDDQKIAPGDLPASWFSAAEVRLGSKGEKDLIVASKGPLLGANIDPFWIFIHDIRGYRLALSTSTHDLIVKGRRTHGYRDLELDAMTASTITTAQFRFNGNEYKESAEKTEDIK